MRSPGAPDPTAYLIKQPLSTYHSKFPTFLAGTLLQLVLFRAKVHQSIAVVLTEGNDDKIRQGSLVHAVKLITLEPNDILLEVTSEGRILVRRTDAPPVTSPSLIVNWFDYVRRVAGGTDLR